MTQPTTPSPATRTIVYSALGRLMECFALDLATGTLAKVGEHRFDAIIQYAWPNRARTLLYVATSDSGPMVKVKRPDHFVQAMRIERSGVLTPFGPSIRLGNRPLHLSLDKPERHLLLVYNDPPELTVHRIEADGHIGPTVPQPPLDLGTTPHQVRVTPDNTVVIVPACAHHPTGDIPGDLRLFRYADGRLSPLAILGRDPERAPRWRGVKNGAHGFAPRHVDFHPTQRWLYLSVEAQGEIHLYDYTPDGLSPKPRFIKSTLEGLPKGRSRQLASAIHVHPSGRFVYVSNRANESEDVDGRPVFVGGVNDVAVFSIDPTSGEPRLIQHADTGGLFPRTLGIDTSGRYLIAANQDPGWERAGDGIRRILPSLVVYRIGDDGRLTQVQRHEHPDNGDVCFWVGVETIPG